MNFLRRIHPYASSVADAGKDLIVVALFVNYVGDHLRRNARKKLEKEANKAGFDDVNSYIWFHAYRYQECVAEKGAENSMCEVYKNYWLECKEAQYGIKPAGSEEVHKMLKEDATKAAYKGGYNTRKIVLVDSRVKKKHECA